MEYESYVNGQFEVQVRPNETYFIQHDDFAGFFVDGLYNIKDLHTLLGALIEEYDNG